MKKALLIFAILFCSAQIYSAEPLVKFYLQDGSSKQYNLRDIDSLNVIDKKNNYVMRIHYQDTLVAYYPNEIIGSIKFEKDSTKRDNLNVYIFSYPKSYILSSIDSVIFYIDQYQPLTIGNQVWMLKNLNVDHYRNGDSIPEVRDSATWRNSVTGTWCYYNNDRSMGEIYGKLYNWYTVGDLRCLAPSGWHIPSFTEWETLASFLGGMPVAGGKMKSIGTKEAGDGLWYSPNTGATNQSGFSAIPAGRRNFSQNFDAINVFAPFWASSNVGETFTYAFFLYTIKTNMEKYFQDKFLGFSVRCIKNN